MVWKPSDYYYNLFFKDYNTSLISNLVFDKTNLFSNVRYFKAETAKEILIIYHIIYFTETNFLTSSIVNVFPKLLTLS